MSKTQFHQSCIVSLSTFSDSSPVKSRGLWLLILCVGDWCWLYFQAGPAARLSFPKVDLHFGA